MDAKPDFHIWLDREQFFTVGRILKKNWHVSDLGEVCFKVAAGKLLISSQRGGAEIPCEGVGEITAIISARQYWSLIASRGHEKKPSGRMELVFRPEFGEVAIDVAGIKAKFPKAQ